MNNGAVIPVMDYRELNFGFLGASNLDIILRDRIPIAPYTVVGLCVRCHDINVGTATFTFHVYGVDPSPNDGRDFVTASLASTAAIGSGASPPSLFTLTSVLTNPQTPFARVGLRITGASGNIFGIFSADMVLKTG